MMEKLSKSEAKKKYWASIPKEKRTQIASTLAKIKQSKMTPEERIAHSKMMIKARFK